MQNYTSDKIRNVVLLSHSGAGKTSLSEAILLQAKVISRLGRVDDGSTASDYEPEEIKRKISLGTSLLPYVHEDIKVNILDTPGYADFVGEMNAAVRVAEGAVIVVCAASGVEVGTELAWKNAEAAGVARIVFVNKMERENADFYKVFEQLESRLGRKCVAIQLPIGAEHGFEGVVDLITSSPADAPGDMGDRVAEFRDKLAEAAAEGDDDLLTKYLDGEQLTVDELHRGLRAGTIAGSMVPVVVGSAAQGKGVAELMDAITSYLPSPSDGTKSIAQKPDGGQDEELGADASGPLAALVFKTTADPYVGKLTYLKVISGTIASDSHVWNANRRHPERIGQLYSLRGKTQEGVSAITAGDIGAVAKLAETGTSDTLCAKEHPLTLERIAFPSPTLSVAVYPKTKGDMDKMGAALTRLTEEDATMSLHKDLVTAETILSGMGEAHVDVAVEKLKRKFGVDMRTDTPKIPYKETITTGVKAEYKHKKQTGGHGQYGHVVLQLEPLARGTGAEFAAKVVGGSVPKNYVPAVEKAVNEALNDGVVAGYPVTDIRVTLTDGSFHAVDSSDMAFKIASGHAIKEGVVQARPALLEPIMDVQISMPDNYTGDVMGDLNGKRAHVQGMTPGDGINVIDAQVPQAEMLRYAIDLRSITHGRGSFTMGFSHYEPAPPHTVQKLIEEAKKEPPKE